MRGEDQTVDFRRCPHGGSPPHARGRLYADLSANRSYGITPACAGKTGLVRVYSKDYGGSPPHARGRRHRITQIRPAGRITPACAGKTRFGEPRRCAGPDHPRMRGEDSPPSRPLWGIHGSPPHARGRRPPSDPERPRRGITPACAGKTLSWFRGKEVSPDHPRMRGEDSIALAGRLGHGGSPPHARGRLGRGRPGRRRRRITPACAGKTTAETVGEGTSSDHPRMRGEDHTRTTMPVDGLGSPPHARGRPARTPVSRSRARITPACAGKTVIAGKMGPGYSDHPRMRGEDENTSDECSNLAGSPPHARGRRRCQRQCLCRVGITPACAGKTFAAP